MSQARYSVDTAAAVTGFPRGTLAMLVSRKQAPGFPYEPADLCSLLLAKKLTERGMATEPACAIGWAMRDSWAEVILADDDAKPDHQRSRYLAVAPNPPGDPIPYTWVLAPSGDELIEFIDKGDQRGVTFLVNASNIVRHILTQLLEHSPSRKGRAGRTTKNGALAITADPLPARKGKELA